MFYSYGVCFSGSGEGSPLIELLGVYGGSEIVSTIGTLNGNRYGKIWVFPPREWKFGSEARSEVIPSIGSSYGSR